MISTGARKGFGKVIYCGHGSIYMVKRRILSLTESGLVRPEGETNLGTAASRRFLHRLIHRLIPRTVHNLPTNQSRAVNLISIMTPRPGLEPIVSGALACSRKTQSQPGDMQYTIQNRRGVGWQRSNAAGGTTARSRWRSSMVLTTR
jgi:hypothetical protein